MVHLKKAFLFAYRGHFKEALQIAEDSRVSMVPPSRVCYNLSLSELSTLAKENEKAEEYFLSAVRHGANPLDCLVTRMRGYFFAGDIGRSLQEAEPYLDKSSLLQLEYAIISLTALDKSREARNYCEAVLGRDSILHPSGTETHDLARLMLSCLDLKSGKAEQALPEISMMLAIITPQLAIFPGLRPYISLVYLIRAKYFAGQRRTYLKAKYDVERAIQLCAYPINKKMAEEIVKVVGNGLV